MRWSTAAACLLVLSAPARSDSTDAACVIHPAGSDHGEKLVACRFYQAQGHVVITRSDGVEHDLTPTGSAPGEFTNAQGDTVYRQSDLGDQGLIFRFPDESVYVYWNTRMLARGEDGGLTSPYGTDDYDATAMFRCRAAGKVEFGQCPGGVLRMDSGEASIVVLGPSGEEFTINFLSDYINATNRAVDARLEDDTWILVFENGEVWEVPLAAIEGG